MRRQMEEPSSEKFYINVGLRQSPSLSYTSAFHCRPSDKTNLHKVITECPILQLGILHAYDQVIVA